MSKHYGKAEEDPLKHQLRQVILVVLRQQTGTARKLQEIIGHPLSIIDYHLKVLVKEGYLEVRPSPEGNVYSPLGAVRRAKGAEGGMGRTVMLTFLDAAWAALGRCPETLKIDPRFETFPLDELGLIEASEAIAETLARCAEISRNSRYRDATPSHTLVGVASLAGPSGQSETERN